MWHPLQNKKPGVDRTPGHRQERHSTKELGHLIQVNPTEERSAKKLAKPQPAWTREPGPTKERRNCAQEHWEYKGYKIILQLYVQNIKWISYTKWRIRLYEGNGNNGVFWILFESFMFRVIAGDGIGWEHVSISLPNRAKPYHKLVWDIFYQGFSLGWGRYYNSVSSG